MLAKLFTLVCLVAVLLVGTVGATEQLWFPFDHQRVVTCGWGCYSDPFHAALDYSCPEGTDLYSPITGVVVTAVNYEGQSCSPIYGTYVKIRSHDNTTQVILAHMQYGTVTVTEGADVQAGQLVGKSGNTGNTWTWDSQTQRYVCMQGGGYHLHLETQVFDDGWTSVNPETYDGGMWTNPLEFGKSVNELMDDVFIRNGGENTVGHEVSGIYSYGDYGYLRKDFSGGTFGNCCIMYDPNNGAGNELATNEAYLIRTGFYDYYQAHGGSALGCPTRDEYSSRDPENWNDPTEYPLQNFFDREAYENGEASQHYMIWKNGVASYHSAYTTAYVSQTPSGQFNMQQGTSRAFTVKFRNTGSNTWYNSSSHLDGYVELKSCDASGTVMGSFLYYTTWLNNISPCTMQEASVAPGGVATFTFTGKVATNATVGLHNVYFRVNHSVGGLMTDWGGMHFQVNVTAIPVYSCQYVSQSPAGQFNFGEGTTQLIYVKFKNTGNTTWRKSASSYPNDFVKLVSCNSSGTVVPSFFNKPYDDAQGWIDDENVCTFVETSVAPGGTGTFRFTARVQEGQSPGLYNVYFRVHHATGGFLSDWAGMHFQPNVPKSYSTDFVSRSPTGTITMSPGQTKTFTLKFKNTGNTTWRKSASSYPNDYVEIKSCDDDGVKCASFLNWPYTTSIGWLNYESPCTFTESSVAPGATATFTFTGKVASGTSAGTRYVYFRPNHSKAGLLPGWEGGYFIISVSGSGKVTAEGLPTEFSLHQNYPNPFNPTTTISYSLPSETYVRLDIFNILGQCVQTLVDEHQSAGEHSVLWTSSGFSSGIYLYRIQTGEATETKKMILLK